MFKIQPMRAIFYLLSPILLLTSACGAGGQGSGTEGPSINGTIQGAGGSTVHFQKREGKGFVSLDSAKLDAEGSFSMPNPAGDLDYYFLNLDRSKRMVLITDSSSSVRLTVDSTDFGNTLEEVEGSEHTELLYQYFEDLDPLKKRMDSLKKIIRGGKRNKELQTAFQDTRKAIEDLTVEFVEKNPNSPAIIPALGSINPRSNIDLLKDSYKNLKDGPLKGSPYLAHLNNKIKQVQAKERQMKRRKQQQKERQKMLKKGKEAPDISLKTPQGKVKSLSSLEGKVVLIDFWASWCKPCIRTIPKLKKVYDRYADQGFEIYGVSLDKKRQSWTKAIDKYGMDWIHVSDLKYFNSAAAQKYKVRSIPYTVLVDREGEIIATGLRGQELVKKIEEVMG